MKEFLIVVDVQNDFINGSLGNKEAEAVVPRIKEKVNEYIKKGNMVFYTRDTHNANYLFSAEGKKLPVKHCIKGTDGWQIEL